MHSPYLILLPPSCLTCTTPPLPDRSGRLELKPSWAVVYLWMRGGGGRGSYKWKSESSWIAFYQVDNVWQHGQLEWIYRGATAPPLYTNNLIKSGPLFHIVFSFDCCIFPLCEAVTGVPSCVISYLWFNIQCSCSPAFNHSGHYECLALAHPHA